MRRSVGPLAPPHDPSSGEESTAATAGDERQASAAERAFASRDLRAARRVARRCSTSKISDQEESAISRGVTAQLAQRR
jgi:hypothetical protein